MASFAPLVRKPVTPTAKPKSPEKSATSRRRRAPVPLPFGDQLQRAFGPKHDLQTIRAHVGPEAAAASRVLGAHAYASGSDVVFGGTPTVAGAAHEATHVIQQRAGVVPEGLAGARAENLEREADAVADRVAGGHPAADLLDHYEPQRATPAATLQRDALSGAAPLDAASTGVVGAVLAALSKPDAIAGVGDYSAAFAALAPLGMNQLLAALTEVERRGSLDLLLDNEGAARARPEGARIVAAMRTVRAAGGGRAAPDAGGTRLGRGTDSRRVGARSERHSPVLVALAPPPRGRGCDRLIHDGGDRPAAARRGRGRGRGQRRARAVEAAGSAADSLLRREPGA
jgi:hypothetical protein